VKRREYTVRISHQHGKDIPQWLFAKMLRQAGLTRDEFERLCVTHDFEGVAQSCSVNPQAVGQFGRWC